MKFLCDQMLGSLAKWLRLLGYDTIFANNIVRDDELLKQAEEERRILITRDKELIKRAYKRKIECIPLYTSELDDQIRLVIGNKIIDKSKILTICSVCNRELKVASRSQVLGKIPERIYNEYTFFWYCPRCERIYWKGSHYDMIKDKIKCIQE